MESRVRVLGHPLHQILVMFPVGMFGWAAACDAIAAAGDRRGWADAARRTIGGAVIGALAAAPFGLVDWLAIPHGTRAKALGRVHGLGNLGVVALYAASWFVRRRGGSHRLAVALSTSGLVLAGATAWMGSELVNRLGVGVSVPTDLDASNSIGEAGLVSVRLGPPDPRDGATAPVVTARDTL